MLVIICVVVFVAMLVFIVVSCVHGILNVSHCASVKCVLGNVTALCYVYFQLRTAVFKAYCAIWVRRSNFRH
jgi:hypothetical protein